MSVVTPIADKRECGRIVRFVPIADIGLIRTVGALRDRRRRPCKSAAIRGRLATASLRRCAASASPRIGARAADLVSRANATKLTFFLGLGGRVLCDHNERIVIGHAGCRRDRRSILIIEPVLSVSRTSKQKTRDNHGY